MEQNHQDPAHQTQEGEDPRWLDKPGSVKKIILITLAICAASTLADLFYHKHGHFKFEEIFGFQSLYGFVSCVLLVLAATQLRRVLMRDEDYYD